MEKEVETGSLEDLEHRIAHLSEVVRSLRRHWKEEHHRAENLLIDTVRLKAVADRNYRWFVETHNALDVLREDADRALTDGGVKDLHAELTQLREDKAVLLAQRAAWRNGRRRYVEAKVAEAERARGLEAVVQQLSEKIGSVEAERAKAIDQAQAIIDDRDGQLARIREQCSLWNRGELGTMTTVAGICAEFRGHPLPEPGAWDRARAIKEAEMRSQLQEADAELDRVNAALHNAGVDFPQGAQGVRDLARLLAGAQEAFEEREREQ